MELTIKPVQRIKLIYEGKEYLLKKFTLGQAIAAEKAIKENDGSGGSRQTLQMLVDAGLPESVAKDLDIDSVSAVVDGLMPKKKS